MGQRLRDSSSCPFNPLISSQVAWQNIQGKGRGRSRGWVLGGIWVGGIVILQVVTLILFFSTQVAWQNVEGKGPVDGAWAEFGPEAL